MSLTPVWCLAPLEMNEGTHLGVRVQSAFGCSAEKAPLRDLYLLINSSKVYKGMQRGVFEHMRVEICPTYSIMQYK